MSEEFEKRMLERQRAREERRKKWSNLISEEKKQDEVNLSKSEEMKLKMANNLKMGINTLKSMSKEKIILIASNENLNNINNKTNGDISHNNNTTNNNTSNNGNISNHNTSPQNNDNIKKLSVKDIQVNNNKSEQKPKVENNIKSNEENNKSDTSGKNLDRRSQRKERLERKIKESLEKEKQEKEQKRLEIMKKYQEQISQRKGSIGIVNNNYNDLLEREKLENERKEKEEEERREKEKKEKERIDQLEKEKREKERKEKERVDLLEKERLEKQKREKEEKERLEKERIEKEKKEKERIDQLEKLRSEKERIEKEKKEKERIDQLEKEKREKERKEKEEEVRREKEKKEKERMDQLERERVEKEKKQKEEFERIEKEKKEKERLELLEKEKKEMEDKQKVTERPLSEREKRELLRKQRREKLQNSSEETEKEEIKKKEMEENERKEKERIEKERLEKEKKEKEDKEKLEKEKELLSKIDKPTKVEQVTKEDKPKKKPKKKKPTKMMARSITQIESSNYDFLEEEKKKKPSLKTKKDPLKKLQNLSTTERNVPGVGKPNANKLSLKQLFPNGTGSPPDLEALKEHFRSEGRLEMDAAYEILKQCQPILKKEPNMLNLKTPVKIIGDIHGQYYDLLFLLSKAGDVKNNQYLFMGDYVDRGYFSCEVFLYLAALKITYKENIFLLRGNHESRMCTKNYSFMTECFYKYDEDLYNEFMLTFDNLPLAALLTNKSNDKFLCVHGGISAAIRDFISIEEIYRFGEIPDKGELCDLVWADPMRQEEEMDLEEFRDLRYEINKVRGISYQFGYSALNEFLEMNEICSIIRAHEVQKDGYEELWYGFKKGDVNDIDNGIRKFPPLITVFSAPNYCDFYHNYGGFLQMNDNDLNFVKLKWTEHPYRLPNFLNAVSFSLPLVYENIEKIFLSLFKVESKDNDLKNIVNSITKWDESVKQVREQRKAFLEQISQFQNTPEEETFEKAQDFDQVLEHRHPTKRPVMRRTATSFW